MKKSYLIPVFAMIAGVSFGQRVEQLAPAKALRTNLSETYLESNEVKTSNRGIIWQNGFETPSDWSMFNTSNPSTDWQITATIPANLASQNFSKINSTSGGNFAIIDSDGPGASGTQNAFLVTANPIDLSTYPGVIMKFENYHRRFYEKHFVVVSTDGVNWNEIPVNTNMPVSSNSANPATVSLNISQYAAGSQTVWIGFKYEGAWDWFWMVDDVKLIEAHNNDMVINNLFFNWDKRYGYYSKLPKADLTSTTFEAAVYNNGNLNQTDVRLNVKMELQDGATTTTEFDETGLGKTINKLVADTIALNTAFNPTKPGDYTATFSILQNEMEDEPLDNQKQYKFSITDSVYARDNGNTQTATSAGPSSYTGGDANNAKIGIRFEVANTVHAKSMSVFIHNATALNTSITGKIYKVEEVGGQEVYTQLIQSEIYDVVTAADKNKWVTLPFELDQISEIIPANTDIAVVIEVQNVGPSKFVFVGNDLTSPQASGTLVLYLPGSGNWGWTQGTPLVRLNVEHSLAIENASTKGDFKLFAAKPNPASTQTVVNYELAKQTNVSLNVMDLSGKTVLNINGGVKQPGSYSFNLNTANLENGIYFYNLITNEGTKTQKLVVAK